MRMHLIVVVSDFKCKNLIIYIGRYLLNFVPLFFALLSPCKILIPRILYRKDTESRSWRGKAQGRWTNRSAFCRKTMSMEIMLTTSLSEKQRIRKLIVHTWFVWRDGACMHSPVSSLPQSSLKFFSPFAILFSCAALRLTKDGRDRLDLPRLTLDSFRAFAFNGHKRDLTWRSLCNHTIAFMAVAANVYHGTYVSSQGLALWCEHGRSLGHSWLGGHHQKAHLATWKCQF